MSTIRRTSRRSQSPEIPSGAIWWVMTGGYYDRDARFTGLRRAFDHYGGLLHTPSSSERVWAQIGAELEAEAATCGFRPYHLLGDADWTDAERAAVGAWRDAFFAAQQKPHGGNDAA